jgi:uncharacterized protein (TIGR00159 family)
MEKVASFISGLRWQDAVDIALSSYLLFRFYVLFRGTNVLRVLIGIVFLWLFQRISVSLGLIVTSWAIQGVTAGAALIIIVIFRNEIRSALQARNLKAILWGNPRKGIVTPVQIVVESVYDLARKNIGALIVLPGKEDVSEAVHSGITWNGLLSKEMITSIFWHDNPVHDGAAIIQGELVTEVGVVLPLSHRQDFPSYYGTRHRAAAGLSELTDAMVVVVSEERGEVAVAKGSQLQGVSSKGELSHILREHERLTRSRKNHTRKETLELGIAALVSVIFIAGVWLSFTKGVDTMVTVEAPIEYVNRDPAMEILNTSVKTLEIDLSGSGTLVNAIRPGQVKVRIDLAEAAIGRNSFTITPENITLPPGVLLRNVEPPEVDVTLDAIVKKILPVQVDWLGRLPGHLLISAVTIDPPRVEVMGGSQSLQHISTVYTEKVPFDQIKESGTISVKLTLNPPSLTLAPGSGDRVTVQYQVQQRIQ